MNLIKKIQENIFHHQLFSRGAKIVVGVSGGPDSVCLLDVLYKLKEKYNLKIIIAHVNYGLRGKDSEKDENLVEKLAKKYSLPFEIIRNTQYAIRNTNLEEKLRNFRYNFFEKIRKKYKADAIAVGHNLNDQAETVLMRILRGTGLRGLGAIKFLPRRPAPPSRGEQAGKNGNIIRPLLNIGREDILSYLRKNRVIYRIDKTNLGVDFTRNKIRNQLFPYLEKNFNPNIQEVLYKLSQSVADDYDFINRYSQAWLATNKILRASELNKIHPAIQREVIRLEVEKYNPDLRKIESAHIEEVLKIVKSGKSKRQKMNFKKLKIERKGDKLVIGNIGH